MIQPGKYAHALPPLPWSYSTNAQVGHHDGSGFVYLLDANGKKIGTVWGNPDQKLAVAEMICDASDDLASRNELGLQRGRRA
jgi:hypothetical protein